MKLARPDVFHPRIVLAGCAALPDGDGDDAGLLMALRNRGLHARWLPWDDPATRDADVVILRATWDYAERLDEFLSWTRSVSHLINSAQIVEWNTDKRYLDDLHRMGVPVVPTAYFAVGERIVVPAGEVVVKPAVGAGSNRVQRFVDASEALAHAEALHADGRAVLVQPYDPRIADGETALVFLGGKQSHAFCKGPILPPAGQAPEFDTTGTYAQESLSPVEPEDEVWRVGRLAVDAVTRRFDLAPGDLVYARVDVIGGPENPRVLEVELVEPGLGFLQLDRAAREDAERRFAVGVEDALERLGLGPLSHKGF